jgi:hypothetical protein
MSVRPCLTADPGRIVANRDISVAELTLALFEIPEQSRPSPEPSILLAASTTTPQWKRQYVEVHHAGRTQIVQTPPRKSVLGHAVTQLSEGETDGCVEVILYDAGQWLTSCSAEDICIGENLAAVGNEAIQFAEATPLGSGRFRLAGLFRGRAATQCVSHSVGEPFVLLQRGSLQPVALSVWKSGSPVWASALDGSAQCGLSPAFKGLPPSGLSLRL